MILFLYLMGWHLCPEMLAVWTIDLSPGIFLIASLHHVSVANHVHREALVPVFLLCRDTLGAKVCHAVDQAVDLARVSLCDCLQIQSSFLFLPPLLRRAEPDGWIMDAIFINHMYLLLSAVTRTDFYTSVIIL